MSKKHLTPSVSPSVYLRTRARSLTLGECYINRDWQGSGMALIVVSRQHVTGHYTFAVFQVDLMCLGVKDAFWRFNEPPGVFKELLDRQKEFSEPDDFLMPVDYPLVHNIIYGAIEYADELGFRPHKDFALARYILEEDDDRIELVDVEFGMNGIPAIFQGKENYPGHIIDALNKSVGKGNYYILNEDGDVLEGPDDEEEEEVPKDEEEGRPSLIRQISHDTIQYDTERLMKYFQEQNFSTPEELRAFMEKNVIGRRIEDIIPEKKGMKTGKEKAEELMSRAYRSNPKKGVGFAKQALENDPENIRALNYMAGTEKDDEKSLALYAKAAEIGEKKLGKDFFKENRGHFWDMVEARPYMTARQGMAQCLNEMGKWEEAVDIMQEMLILNPNDNQGVRYDLSTLLLYNKQYNAFYRLYRTYNDDWSAAWLYNYAYYLFIRYGPDRKAVEALQKAYQANKYVIEILTGKSKPPKKVMEYYKPGQKDEAAYYLFDNFKLWRETPGAMEWIGDWRSSAG